MNPHRLTLHFVSFCLILFTLSIVSAQKQKAPLGGRLAVVVDERLSALRTTPELNGKLIRRLGRGRLVAVRAVKTNSSGIVFYLVNVSSRTHGWIQREAVGANWRYGDDERLLHLIQGSSDFDRIVRARLFLDYFPRSPLRPEVLLILGDAAEQAANKLSKDAERRISSGQTFALELSLYMNHPALDRYNRQGVVFVFDRQSKRFHYDGLAWREILRRFPSAPQANEARKRFESLAVP